MWAAINANAEATAEAQATASAAADAAAEAWAEASAAAEAAAEAWALADSASRAIIDVANNIQSLWSDSTKIWAYAQGLQRSIAAMKPAFESVYASIRSMSAGLSTLTGNLSSAWSSLDGTIQSIYDYIGCVVNGLEIQTNTDSLSYCSGTETASLSYVSDVTLQKGCSSGGGSSGLDGALLVDNLFQDPLLNNEVFQDVASSV